MWKLKVLSSSQQEQTLHLESGTYILGRGKDCDIPLDGAGISKQHAQLVISPVGSFIKDLGSRNGVFVNGIKVIEKQLYPGERVSLSHVFLELEPQENMIPAHLPAPSYSSGGSLAYENSPEEGLPQSEVRKELSSEQKLFGLVDRVHKYVEDVVLPGVYKLPELLEMKWVLALFFMLFVVFVTSLSVIPLVRILKASIEQESQRRSMTIVKTLNLMNRDSVAKGVYSSLSVDFALREPGVKEAYILNSVDGTVLAPAKKIGLFPDVAYVHQARQSGEEGFQQVDNSTIISVSPIAVYDSERGAPVSKALAVVVYNMGSLAVEDERMISLFIQTLFIALLVGALIFFFVWKIVEKPVKSLNEQIDEALISEDALVSSSYQFPILQKLIDNINNTLNKMRTGLDSEEERVVEQDRSLEMSHLVELVGFAAMTLRGGDFTVSALNSSFEETLGLTSGDLLYKTLDQFPEQSLKLTIQNLIDESEKKPGELCTQPLEFSGINYDVALHSIYGTDSVAYYLIVIVSQGEEDYE